jgi:hypothetical protein
MGSALGFLPIDVLKDAKYERLELGTLVPLTDLI